MLRRGGIGRTSSGHIIEMSYVVSLPDIDMSGVGRLGLALCIRRFKSCSCL